MFVTKKRFQEAIDNGDKDIAAVRAEFLPALDRLSSRLSKLEDYLNLVYESAKLVSTEPKYRKKTKKDCVNTDLLPFRYIARMLSRRNDTY